jgi:hypothetical protein
LYGKSYIWLLHDCIINHTIKIRETNRVPEGTPPDRTEAQEPYKISVSGSERILRKTLEIIERPFTTEVKGFRIRTGYTIVIRRCQDVMKMLWQRNMKKVASKDEIESAIFFCVGGDYRTIKKYIGFERVTKGGTPIWTPGYLERLHYIEKLPGGFSKPNYRLNHIYVPLNYHYEEKFPSVPSSQICEGSSSINKMCVCAEGNGSSLDAMATDRETNKTNKHNTHTNQLSESIPIPQKAVVETQLSPAEEADLEERDRKRVGVLDRELLPFLENRLSCSGFVTPGNRKERGESER